MILRALFGAMRVGCEALSRQIWSLEDSCMREGEREDGRNRGGLYAHLQVACCSVARSLRVSRADHFDAKTDDGSPVQCWTLNYLG